MILALDVCEFQIPELELLAIGIAGWGILGIEMHTF